MEYGYVTLIAVAALWGAAAGVFVPRPAYRLSVEPEQGWRDVCPAGHPFTGRAGGWLGAARCPSCAVAAPAPAPVAATTSPASPDAPENAAPEDAGPGTPGDAGHAPVPYRPSLLVAAVTALACAALAAAVGPRPELAVWVLLAPVAVLLAIVDRNVHRLPDRLTLPLAVAAAVLLAVAALLPEAAGSWRTALLGGPALGAAYLVLFLINPNGMGFGDVKLALSLGVALGWYGWPVLFVGAFAGFALGAVYGLGLVVLRGAGRKTAIPFGPFMISGALIGLLLGGLAA
ncbi:prepilin peptidase [Streptomyces sp. NPDC059881]|uniref:prepilin peptidase n=1 Tax=Streptomyces sp. NPDC059881 TaxID=3346986 RepID=UPI003664C2F1